MNPERLKEWLAHLHEKHEGRAIDYSSTVYGAALKHIKELEELNQAEMDSNHRLIARNLELEGKTWHPIETAPRDGTIIIVYFQQHGALTVFWDSPNGESLDRIWCVDDYKFGPYAVRGYRHGDDTHWMPLPKPPQALEKDDEGLHEN